MKHWAAAIGTTLMLMMANALPALAHTEASDGKISGLLHIEPNDTAKAGQTNTIHVYFNDQDGRFTMEGCDCKIKITQDDKVLLNEPLDTAAIKAGVTKVFLPQDNFSYDVTVSGTPKSAGFFQPFKLTFDIDAGNPPALQAAAEDGSNLLVRLVEASIIVGVIVISVLLAKRIKMKG